MSRLVMAGALLSAAALGSAFMLPVAAQASPRAAGGEWVYVGQTFQENPAGYKACVLIGERLDASDPSKYQGYNCIADDPAAGRYGLWMYEVS
jgi:hypothetical protein